jgi:putative ATP-binding cassette transporter
MLGFLCRSSWLTIVGVLLAGIISGLSSAALVALINSTLSNTLDAKLLPWLFGGLAIAVLFSGFLSHYLLNRLSTKTVCNLRIHISRLILAAPYPYLQKLGKSALLAHLTEDITAIANASQLLPVVCINFAVVTGCMVYLTWLSWHLSLVLGGVIVFGVLSSSLFREWPKKAVFKARNEYDVLSGNFRALTEGIRELKLHQQRSDAFMTQSLAASAEAYRQYSFRGAIAFLVVNQWAQFLYYLAIGVILYVFPVWQVIDQKVIGGYALVFLFMMSPLTILTTSLPIFSRAKVALQKIRQLGDQLNSQILRADASDKPERFASFSGLSLQGVTHSSHR